MDCLVLPVSLLKRCYTRSRLGYRPLTEDGFGDLDSPVTVLVGKERKEFLVDPFVLEESPFRVLIETVKQDRVFYDTSGSREEKRVIFVDVDAILFEHMLWLMYNDCSSLFQLNLKEIIDFYAQDC
ncbi:hypothetical protein OIU79_010600 [Salix purpurea]|uniref:Uncharacterized protein n=2 Tax=Salix TaxID=40685 RepID=A0A9Q0QGF3_SALPP|nr:auxin-responsive protein [Salix suchowensis]KAJ6695854.1 hypothetical protein OIU74_014871 [Salix koriyanagi]KAJ6705971.1 hypothetical protein OIU79_010600 [Salix purpurea]